MWTWKLNRAENAVKTDYLSHYTNLTKKLILVDWAKSIMDKKE